MRNKKWWIIGGVGAVIAILAVSLGVMVHNAQYSVTLDVTVAPAIARVRVGEESYAPVGTYKLKPGEYDVEITAEGFTAVKGKLVATAGETVSILTFLNAEEGNDWYATHPEDALIMGEVKNKEVAEELKELGENNPILNKLPHGVDYYTADYSTRVKYTVSYEVTNDGYILVVKDYSGGNRERALMWMREQGVDTEVVPIKYEDLTAEYSGGHAG